MHVFIKAVANSGLRLPCVKNVICSTFFRKDKLMEMKKLQRLIDCVLEHKALKITVIVVAALLVTVVVYSSWLTWFNHPEFQAANDLFSEGKYEEAKLAYETLLKHSGNPFKVINCIKKCDEAIKAINLYNNGNYSEAKRIFVSLLQKFYDHTNLVNWIEKCDEALSSD